MYPRIKYGLADGHDNGPADDTEAPAMHEREAGRLAAVASETADQATPESAATAAPATTPAHAAAVSA